MSIVVNGVIHMDAADLEALREALMIMQTESRAEAGCREYAFSLDLADTHALRITECWDSMDALQAHFASPHMATFRAKLAARPPRGSEVSFFEATEMESPLR